MISQGRVPIGQESFGVYITTRLPFLFPTAACLHLNELFLWSLLGLDTLPQTLLILSYQHQTRAVRGCQPSDRINGPEGLGRPSSAKC